MTRLAEADLSRTELSVIAGSWSLVRGTSTWLLIEAAADSDAVGRVTELIKDDLPTDTILHSLTQGGIVATPDFGLVRLAVEEQRVVVRGKAVAYLKAGETMPVWARPGTWWSDLLVGEDVTEVILTGGAVSSEPTWSLAPVSTPVHYASALCLRPQPVQMVVAPPPPSSPPSPQAEDGAPSMWGATQRGSSRSDVGGGKPSPVPASSVPNPLEATLLPGDRLRLAPDVAAQAAAPVVPPVQGVTPVVEGRAPDPRPRRPIIESVPWLSAQPGEDWRAAPAGRPTVPSVSEPAVSWNPPPSPERRGVTPLSAGQPGVALPTAALSAVVPPAVVLPAVVPPSTVPPAVVPGAAFREPSVTPAPARPVEQPSAVAVPAPRPSWTPPPPRHSASPEVPEVSNHWSSGAASTDPDPGDDGGLPAELEATVNRAALAAAAGDLPVGPTVFAVNCPQGHVTSAHAASCRVCRLPLVPQEVRSIPRPVLGTLRLSTGDTVRLDRGVVFGRAPEGHAALSPERPHVMRLKSPHNDLSRNHAEIVLDGWDVYVRDLNSTNGTTVTLSGQDEVRLRADDLFLLEPGALLNLADEVNVVFEVSE